jgi:hypothetical protein
VTLSVPQVTRHGTDITQSRQCTGQLGVAVNNLDMCSEREASEEVDLEVFFFRWFYSPLEPWTLLFF